MQTLNKSIRAVLLFVLLLSSFSGFAPQAHAQTYVGDALGLSPFWDWKTIETENFRLTFPKELEGSAQKAAGFFEEAHQLIDAKLKWDPLHKTQILLIDNSDSANGLTSAVARFGIVLYMTPPDNWFSTAYYDDWLRLLVFHEYTHMVNMDTTRGIWSFLRVALGDVLLPNSAWPSWMLEGLAVYMETRFTHAGRGRSPYYEMLLRSAVSRNVLDTPEFITLDKVNGPNPYFPYGETAYTFGYQLMNQVARDKVGPRTADNETFLSPGAPGHEGENQLGEMSFRSGNRVPFFINGNLENISGRDWYAHWKQFVQDTQARVRDQLLKIRSAPESKIDVIATIPGKNQTWDTLGFAFSPDGRWMAYTQASSDEHQALYLQDRHSGKAQELDEKISGATLAFSPDSKNLIFSTLNRKGVYYIWSDLKAYSLTHGKITTLTDGQRARDPDFSRDGKWATFTIARDQSIGLALVPVREVNGRLRIGKSQEIFWPASEDSVYTPKFSADGNEIYFSWHVNGQPGERLAAFHRDTGKVEVLVADGGRNRYPAVNSHGDLYFVSDRTGVDNIYTLSAGQAELVTNTETGFRFPTFDEKDRLFADSFSYKGWQPASVEVLAPINPAKVTIAPPPAPPIDDSISKREAKTYPVEDYSIIPSIWPRQWAPIFFAYPGGAMIGGQVFGFDAVDRHRYILAGAYDSFAKAPDIFALYSNRSFGPNLNLSVESYTADISVDNSGLLQSYSRNLRYQASADFPILWTFSSLTPIVSLYEERTWYKVPGANPSDKDTVAETFWVPYADARLVFNEAHQSPLAITTEKGRFSEIGARTYFDSGHIIEKAFAQDKEFLRTDFLMKHSVLIPSVSYSWVSFLQTQGYIDSDVTVEGRQAGRLINTLPGQSLDQLVARGYPLRTFFTRQAAVGSLDYRFPIAPIFRGWGTNPIFLDQVYGFVFGESTWFPNGRSVRALPATGGGLQASVNAFNAIPLEASAEYHKGFREDFGGKGELFFQLNLNSPISF